MSRLESTCTVADCERAEHSRSLCGTHSRGHVGAIRRVRHKGASQDRDDEGRKQCATCHVWKLDSLFGSNARRLDGLSDSCTDCTTSRPKRHRSWSYRMTEQQFIDMFAAQGGCCAICGRSEPGSRGWTIDHDHSCCEKTPTCGLCTRGILCQRCNTGLGQFEDSARLVAVALSYLDTAR